MEQGETEAWTGRQLKVTLRKTRKDGIARQGTLLSGHFFMLYQPHFQQPTEQDHHRKIMVETYNYLVNNHIF